MNLFEVLGDHLQLVVIRRLFPLQRVLRMVQGFQGGRHQLEKLLMLEIAGGGHDDPFRLKRPGEIAEDAFPIDAFHGLSRPVNGNPQGIVLPEHLLEQNVDIFVRGVLDHPDFLDDDLLFPGDFLGSKDRVEKNVGQDIDHQGQVAGAGPWHENRRFPWR